MKKPLNYFFDFQFTDFLRIGFWNIVWAGIKAKLFNITTYYYDKDLSEGFSVGNNEPLDIFISNGYNAKQIFYIFNKKIWEYKQREIW